MNCIGHFVTPFDLASQHRSFSGKPEFMLMMLEFLVECCGYDINNIHNVWWCDK